MHDIAIEPTAMARTKAAPANRLRSMSGWPHRLWTMDKHYHYIGDGGGCVCESTK